MVCVVLTNRVDVLDQLSGLVNMDLGLQQEKVC